MIVDETVRGQLPPPWFWALPGIDRIRAFSLSQLPSPPISRLLGIRPAHVGPGFEDRGRHLLKDVPGEWQLFALVE